MNSEADRFEEERRRKSAHSRRLEWAALLKEDLRACRQVSLQLLRHLLCKSLDLGGILLGLELIKLFQ